MVEGQVGCFRCAGFEHILVPFRDETDWVPCPECFPESKITLQHPSVKISSMKKMKRPISKKMTNNEYENLARRYNEQIKINVSLQREIEELKTKLNELLVEQKEK